MSNQPDVLLYGTPCPQADESPDSWLLRTAILHRLSVPDIYGFMKVDAPLDAIPEIMLYELPTKSMAILFQLDVIDIEGIQQRAYTLDKARTENTRFFLKDGCYKVCSICLKSDEAPFIRWTWKLTLSILCEKHIDQLLFEQCPLCGMNLSWIGSLRPTFDYRYWHTESLVKCAHCGFDLRLSKNQSSDKDLIAIYKTHSKFLNMALDTNSKSSANVSGSPLDITNIIPLLQFINSPDSSIRKHNSKNKGSSIDLSELQKRHFNHFSSLKTKHITRNDLQPYCPSCYSLLPIPYKLYSLKTENNITGDYREFYIEPYIIRLRSKLGPQWLPYGSISRRIIYWLTSVLVANQNSLVTVPKVTHLTRLFYAKMPRNTGSKHNSLLRDHFTRIFNCEWKLSTSTDTDIKYNVFSLTSTHFFDYNNGEWPDELQINQEAFNLLTKNSAPLPKSAVLAYSSSPIRLDIICWLTLISREHNYVRHIPWDRVLRLFPCEAKFIGCFRRDFKLALQDVISFFPELEFNIDHDGLTISRE